MSYLKKLKAGIRNRKTIKFPGTDKDVVLRVLSELERQEAHFAAEFLFRDSGIEVTMATADEYEAEKTRQLLWRALSDPEGKPVAPYDDFKRLLNIEEREILVEEYMSLEKECSPRDETMSQEEMDELIEDLKKRPEETAGSVSSIVSARRLIVSLASLLATSRKDSGSISS